MGWLRLMWRRLGSWGPVVTGHCLSAGLSVPVRSAGGAVKLGEVHWGGAACYSVRPPTRGLKRDTEMSAALENEDSRKIQLFGLEDELMSVVTKKTAKLLASKRGLRLVEIDSTAKPHPTYQLMTGTDLHGLQVQQRQKKKASKSTEKNVRVATKISEHDLEIKLKQVHDHLTKGHHVRFTVTTKKSKISEPQDSGGSDHGRIIRTLGERLDSVATVTKAVDDGKILVVLLRPLIEEPGAQKDTATTAD